MQCWKLATTHQVSLQTRAYIDVQPEFCEFTFSLC